MKGKKYTTKEISVSLASCLPGAAATSLDATARVDDLAEGKAVAGENRRSGVRVRQIWLSTDLRVARKIRTYEVIELLVNLS